MNHPEQALTATGTNSCSVPRCRRRPTRRYTSGLCLRHHQELVADTDSEFALTGGRWVPGRHGIRVWSPGRSA